MDNQKELKLRLGFRLVLASMAAGLLALGYLTADHWVAFVAPMLNI